MLSKVPKHICFGALDSVKFHFVVIIAWFCDNFISFWRHKGTSARKQSVWYIYIYIYVAYVFICARLDLRCPFFCWLFEQGKNMCLLGCFDHMKLHMVSISICQVKIKNPLPFRTHKKGEFCAFFFLLFDNVWKVCNSILFRSANSMECKGSTGCDLQYLKSECLEFKKKVLDFGKNQKRILWKKTQWLPDWTLGFF